MANAAPVFQPPPPWSVTIAGGGIVGLALALACKRSLGESVAIEVADPHLGSPKADERAFALSAGACRMLTALGLWPDLAAEAQPIRKMVISDGRLEDPVRPAFLSFEGEGHSAEAYATTLPAAPLARALARSCIEAGVRFRADAIVSAEPATHRIRIRFRSGQETDATLLVACDGSRSRLREDAGIGWVGWRYPQVGLTATIGHSLDHEGFAFQNFLPAGPIATLPLRTGSEAHRSSIVWTEDEEAAADLLARPQDALEREIARRVGPRLGDIRLLSRLRGHPLRFGHARRFAAERLALVGDAAHEIHPLAGQGLNLGLADAAALADEIADAVRLGLDPGAPVALRGYETRRRPDAAAMAAATDGLNRLFSNDRLPVRLLRGFGLGLVDRLPALKDLFIGKAAGIGAGGARLLKGELP